MPRLAGWVPIVVGICVAGAITLAGWGSANIWWHGAQVAAAVLVAGAAVLVVRDARHRRGIHGLRGLARQQWTGCLVAAIAFFVIALSATPQSRVIYAGLGVVAGAVMAVLFYRRRWC
jgi:hypothetical protein